MASKDVRVLLPRTRGYVTFHGKRDFFSVIKLEILRWGENQVLSRWFYKIKTEAGGGLSQCWGVTGSAIGDKECKQPLKAGKGTKPVSLRSPSEILESLSKERSPAVPLILAQ